MSKTKASAPVTSSEKRDPGWIKLRRGLCEHLPAMSGNALKLYVWLLFKARWTGAQKGSVDATFEDIATSLGFSQKTLQRMIEELEQKPFIRVQRAANQHELTHIEILKYDLDESSSGVDKFDQSNSSALDVAVDTGVDGFDHSTVHSNSTIPLEQQALQAPKNAVEGKNKEQADAVRRSFDAELRPSTAFLLSSGASPPNPLKEKSQKLRERIAEKIKAARDRFSDWIARCTRDGDDHPFGALEKAAFDFIGYQPDFNDPCLSSSFVFAVADIYERHCVDGTVTPGNLCSKVIDYLMSQREGNLKNNGDGAGNYWPPEFEEHRDQLRRRERKGERGTPGAIRNFGSAGLSPEFKAQAGLPKLEPIRR